MKFDSAIDAYEATGSAKAYYEQFPSVVPEVGEIYYQHKGNWQEAKFKIIWKDAKVALGICIDGLGVGDYRLFHASGICSGWKYQDGRPCYRLTK